MAPLLAQARTDDREAAATEFAAIANTILVILIGVADVSQLAQLRKRYAAEAGATSAVNNAADVTSSDSK